MLYGNTGYLLVMSIFNKYGNLEQNARSGETNKVTDLKDGEAVEAVVEGSEANWGRVNRQTKSGRANRQPTKRAETTSRKNPLDKKLHMLIVMNIHSYVHYSSIDRQA